MKTAHRATSFIRRFDGPGDNSGIVCFKFWQLVAAGGCPYRCSYCFLQTVTTFRCRPETLHGLIYTNVHDMLEALDRWLDDPVPKMLIVGELQDGLVFEQAFKKVTGNSLAEWIVPRFARQTRHHLIFLTKSTEVQFLRAMPSCQQVVLSWSVNAEDVATQWEVGPPLPSERFAAAEQMKADGWRIRFRLDPMVPYKGWPEGYAAAVDRINEIGPEMVTLGALRATSGKSLRKAALKNGRDDSIFDFLTEERDASGFKYRIPYERQVELFRFATERLTTATVPALCKEDFRLWRDLGLPFRVATACWERRTQS